MLKLRSPTVGRPDAAGGVKTGDRRQRDVERRNLNRLAQRRDGHPGGQESV